MPYTWGLLTSVPDLSGGATALLPIPGTPPSMLNPPTGCSFHPRCTFVDKVPGDLCVTTLPRLKARATGRTRPPEPVPPARSCRHLRDTTWPRSSTPSTPR